MDIDIGVVHFQIENDFGYDDFWDDIETLKFFRTTIERDLGIKCNKCNTCNKHKIPFRHIHKKRVFNKTEDLY